MKSKLLIITFFLLAGVGFITYNKTNTAIINDYQNYNESSSKTKTKETIKDDTTTTEQTSSSKYSQIKTITFSEFEKIVNKENEFVVIISSSACSHCLNFEPIVNEALTELDSTIYRLDILNLSSTEREKLNSFYQITGTPTILAFQNKKVVDKSIGEKDKETFIKWYEGLSE